MAAALTLSFDLDASVTFAPAAAAALAVANPIPELPPNTSTRVSAKERPIRLSSKLEFYNVECRTSIVRMRPKFAYRRSSMRGT
jgi:hypothetical protein